MKIIEGLIQGSTEWKALRAKYPCASEAPVIMGASKHMTRAELLRLKSAGMEKEFSDYVQKMVLDKGHEVERPARAITEEEIGEDLFPATAVTDDDSLLASLDGVTMIEDTIFEHKQWNEELAAAVRAGDLGPEYYWQLEQQLIVADQAEKVIFVCSDGTRERRVQMEYRRMPGRAEQLRAGWKQFFHDLAHGDHTPVPPKAVAPQVEALPAVMVRMDGALKVVSNLDALAPVLRTFIDRIPSKPSTDEDFAFTDAACKALKKIEEALDAAEASALASLDAVEQMQRLKASLHKLARDTRLQREKLVEARKLEIRTEEITRGKQALAEFIAGLNTTIGKPYMPLVPADFAAKIKGLRTVQSVRDAVDQHLADCKLVANEIAGKIMVNRRALQELAKEHVFLFADTAQLVLKAPDDCRAVITSRIAAHQAEQERKLAAEREQIRREEEARAQAKARAEQEAREAEERRQRAAAEEAERQKVAAEAERRRQEEWLAGAEEREQRRQAEMAGAALAVRQQQEAAPSVAPSPAIIPMPTRAPAAAPSVPTLKLGDVNRHLAPLAVTAEGLRQLGFEPAGRDRAAVLYQDADLPYILAAAIQHLTKARYQLVKAA